MPTCTLFRARALPLPLHRTPTPHQHQLPAPIASFLVGLVDPRCCCCGWACTGCLLGHFWGWGHLVFCWGVLLGGLSCTDQQGFVYCSGSVQQVWWGVCWCHAGGSLVACVCELGLDLHCHFGLQKQPWKMAQIVGSCITGSPKQQCCLAWRCMFCTSQVYCCVTPAGPACCWHN